MAAAAPEARVTRVLRRRPSAFVDSVSSSAKRAKRGAPVGSADFIAQREHLADGPMAIRDMIQYPHRLLADLRGILYRCCCRRCRCCRC